VVLGGTLVRRADRLFNIIQALRGKTKPTTAAALAQQLEVTTRTIYRDIATLQAGRIPIEGEPGLGYLLRKGFDHSRWRKSRPSLSEPTSFIAFVT
jgi:predicted DNA-binding transcriptional regulator YafY